MTTRQARAIAAVAATHRHYKGGLYRMIAIARECTNRRDGQRVAIYEGQDGSLYVRELQEFLGHVAVDGNFVRRFQPLETAERGT